MGATADWLTQGRFGVLVYMGDRYLYVVNTAGQYERARELPADYRDRPIHFWNELTGKWQLSL